MYLCSQLRNNVYVHNKKCCMHTFRNTGSLGDHNVAPQKQGMCLRQDKLVEHIILYAGLEFKLVVLSFLHTKVKGSSVPYYFPKVEKEVNRYISQKYQ